MALLKVIWDPTEENKIMLAIAHMTEKAKKNN